MGGQGTALVLLEEDPLVLLEEDHNPHSPVKKFLLIFSKERHPMSRIFVSCLLLSLIHVPQYEKYRISILIGEGQPVSSGGHITK